MADLHSEIKHMLLKVAGLLQLAVLLTMRPRKFRKNL